MLESAETGRTLDDTRYDAAVERLRSRLLAVHSTLRGVRRQVIVIVSGADGAGKGELVHRLNEWLDPRGVVTHAFWDRSDEESERPHFYRFWRAMPGHGRVGIFFGSWYTRPIIDRVMRERGKREFTGELERISTFERMLTDDGVVLVKLWLHLSEPAQRARLKALEKEGRLGPDDWSHFQQYDRFRRVSDRALAATDTPNARWHAIDATDRRYREVAAGRLLLAALERATAPPKRRRGKGAVYQAAAGTPARSWVPGPSLLDRVNLRLKLDEEEYEREIGDLQVKLSRLAWLARERQRGMVLVFEGWDAAGKGSAIRRVTQAIDPRLYRVIGIAAPTEEERAQHYLWRFWRHVPRDGRITLFDRSWYGRVLVERVEGFAPEADWERAYGEINEFEGQLVDHRLAIAKFWIHISAAEQLRRFRDREKVPWKQHKITADDWRNRKKAPAYREAVEEMVTRCSPAAAPWTLIEGNDKRHARVRILRTIVERLESAL
jgi:polyphosphate:AMP phosphotransferase